MQSYKHWLLCLLAVAIFDQGSCRPNIEDEYVGDGDGEGDYDEGGEEDEDTGPAPVMKSVPLVLEVNVGDLVVLPCEFEGNQDAYSRVWRKDTTGLFVGSVSQNNDPRIFNLPNGSLEIRQVLANYTGIYHCMLPVAGKPQEVAHTLKVKSAAKITSISPSEKFLTIKQTSTLTLECIAHGYPTPSIKWFRDDHVLEVQDTSIHGARYTIDNASARDTGTYKCTATNGQQVPDERVIEIQVHYPPEIKIARESVPTGEGYESVLNCTVTGLKKPELKWYKNGEQKPLVPSERIKLQTDGNNHVLRIFKTTRSDFGDYMCEARNTEGQTSAVIRLTGKPSKPVLETVETEGEAKHPTLTYKIESYAPIEEYELLYKKEQEDEWIALKPTVTPAMEGRFFTLTHVFSGLEPGVYAAQLKAKNNYGWSEFSDVKPFPQEHEGDKTETGLLAVQGVKDSSSAAELRISLALIVSLLVAHFYC